MTVLEIMAGRATTGNGFTDLCLTLGFTILLLVVFLSSLAVLAWLGQWYTRIRLYFDYSANKEMAEILKKEKSHGTKKAH